MRHKLSILLLCVLIAISGCSGYAGHAGEAVYVSQTEAAQTTQAARTPEATGEAELAVWFLDVGQADSILISQGESAVLVDAGNNGDGELVLRFLREQGIEKLDYVVGTHPHEDHIGGLDDVIAGISVGAAILPATESDTQTYRDVLAAMEDTETERLLAVAGDEYAVGGFQMRILGPVAEYDNMNDNSVVMRIEYGETSFLLTGDIEERAEKDILSMDYDISCDVLKAAHHGSESSSTYLFLRESNPSMVVISCGEGNTYGHPHEGPLSRYRDLGATVFRTDLLGTVMMVSDGVTITAREQGIQSPVRHADGEENGLVDDDEIVISEYIGNKNSKIFHAESCSSLPAQKNRVLFLSRKEAVNAGYTPCGICKP